MYQLLNKTQICVQKPFSKNCGGGEIRTHGTLRHSRFQDGCTRPTMRRLQDLNTKLVYLFLIISQGLKF